MDDASTNGTGRPTLLYAAYGSNLHPVRLRARIPAAELLGTGRLRDYGLRFNKRGADGSGKCNIVSAESETPVAVYRLDAEDKATLDAIEGVGSGYRILQVSVEGFGECFAYEAEQTHVDDGMRPFSWYKKLVLAGCRYLSFPDRYHDVVAAVQSLPDPDRRRHARHMALVRRARRHAFALPS